MEFTQENKDGFFNAIESLKKYRRADIIDDKGRSLLKVLYTDLLPNEHILKKTLKENTTFLIGRKGTGKSTIFLRVEEELNNKKDHICIYLDVKTVYESSQTEFIKLEYLEQVLPSEILKKYLIERTLIQSILSEIQKQISVKTKTILERLADTITGNSEAVIEKLEDIKENIRNNEHLSKIEIPIIKEIMVTETKSESESHEKNVKVGGLGLKAELKTEGAGVGIKTDSALELKNENRGDSKIENQFSKIFLQVFQIKEIIIKIKEILSSVNIKHLIILLDDFSEMNDKSIKSFVDVILAPLNNWSEEFIKFKVAAYPNRIYFGKIDPGKVDIINLDFFNLYSEFDRNRMENSAIDFTKRLLDRRIKHYTNNETNIFFDISKDDMIDYYELLFQVSMNVPRILGYILSYCYQSKIISDKLINKSDIKTASQRYYEECLLPFFNNTAYSLMSLNEKISIFQLKDLLKVIIEQLTEIKKRIVTSALKGSLYIPNEPYSSHFYFDPRIEEFVKTLELNFFITKYNDLSDKDGNLASIYSINYGMAQKNNLLWGKPKAGIYTKYFSQRLFDFNSIIKDFLAKTKEVHCINPECNKHFTIEEIKYLEFSNFKCNECGGKVIVENLSPDIKNKLESIDTTKLLPTPEIEILNELNKNQKSIFAREIAEELDYSKQLIMWRAKKLCEDYGYVKRIKELENIPYKYEITDKARKIYFKETNE